MPVFRGIRSAVQSLQVEDQYSNVWKDKARTPVLGLFFFLLKGKNNIHIDSHLFFNPLSVRKMSYELVKISRFPQQMLS